VTNAIKSDRYPANSCTIRY